MSSRADANQLKELDAKKYKTQIRPRFEELVPMRRGGDEYNIVLRNRANRAIHVKILERNSDQTSLTTTRELGNIEEGEKKAIEFRPQDPSSFHNPSNRYCELELEYEDQIGTQYRQQLIITGDGGRLGEAKEITVESPL